MSPRPAGFAGLELLVAAVAVVVAAAVVVAVAAEASW